MTTIPASNAGGIELGVGGMTVSTGGVRGRFGVWGGSGRWGAAGGMPLFRQRKICRLTGGWRGRRRLDSPVSAVSEGPGSPARGLTVGGGGLRLPVTDRPDDLLRRLSDDLGLNYETQDWGILNADGARLDEFVAYFKSVALEPTQRFELADLILASSNDALSCGRIAAIDRILQLAADAESAFAHHIDYWSRLDGVDEFPLAAKLREALAREHLGTSPG